MSENPKELRTENAWFSAIEKREYDHVRASVQKYAGTVNKEGYTGLMRAVIANDDDMVRILVPMEQGLKDSRGYTALMQAAELNRSKICRRLVHFEGNITGGDEDYTALMIAAMAGSFEAVLALTPYLKDRVSKANRNALSYAAERGHFECVRFLMSRESHGDKGPGAPLKYAAENGHADIAAILAQYANGDDEAISKSLTTLSMAQSQGTVASYDITSMIKAIDISRKGMQNFGSEIYNMAKTEYERELENRLKKTDDLLNGANSQAEVAISETAALRSKITMFEEAHVKSKQDLEHLLCELEDCKTELKDCKSRLADAEAELGYYRAKREDADITFEVSERNNLILSMTESKHA